jgi:hypothetical protein
VHQATWRVIGAAARCADCAVADIGSAARDSGGSARERLEGPELRRDQGPGRPVACEDGDCRMKGSRIVEGACVDAEGVALADFSAKNQAAADRTGIAHREPEALRQSAQ